MLLRTIGYKELRKVKCMAQTNTVIIVQICELVWSWLMWAYFELLRLCTNVWAEPINVGTLVVKGLTLYIQIRCIAIPARYGNAHAIPYMACNVATTRRPERL